MGNKLVTSAYDRSDYTNQVECQKPKPAVCPDHTHNKISNPHSPAVKPAHRLISKELLKMATMSIPSECPMSEAESAGTNKQSTAKVCPVPHDQQAASSVKDACPIPADFNTDNMMPAPNQLPSVGQPFPLSTSRYIDYKEYYLNILLE